MKDTRNFVQITRQKKIYEEDLVPFANWMFESIWSKLYPMQILTENLSYTVEGNIVTPHNSPIPDCMSCGACCAAFVCVNKASDSEIEDDDCWEIVKSGSAGDYTVDRLIKRKESDLTCTALEGTLGKHVSCRVYEERPGMCRSFEAGSDRCHAVRRAYGFEPFLSLTEMSEARSKIDTAEQCDFSNKIDCAMINETGSNGLLEIRAKLKDGSMHLIHVFDPKIENWHQMEFEGLTLTLAEELIKLRN